MKYRPSGEKSAWLTPSQCTGTVLTTAIVCGSRKTIWCRRSAITTAYRPSGVKYRLYGSSTFTGAPNAPVAASIGVSQPLVSLLTHNVRRSHDGTTCSGPTGTRCVSITFMVAGSITETVLLAWLGTYTRATSCRTTSASAPGRSAAYRSAGSRIGGIPGSGSPVRVRALAVPVGPGEPSGDMPAIGSAPESPATGEHAVSASSAVADRLRSERRTRVRDISPPVLSWSPGAGRAGAVRREGRASRPPCRDARNAG